MGPTMTSVSPSRAQSMPIVRRSPAPKPLSRPWARKTPPPPKACRARSIHCKHRSPLLRRGGTPAQQTQLQATADQAQAQVNSTRARLEALKNGGVAATRAQAEAQKQQAQGQLVQAQESLKTAQANLKAAASGNLDAL